MLQWYLLSSLCVNLCLANAEALENTFEQTLHDCGEALLPEELVLRAVAGEGLLGFVGVEGVELLVEDDMVKGLVFAGVDDDCSFTWSFEILILVAG